MNRKIILSVCIVVVIIIATGVFWHFHSSSSLSVPQKPIENSTTTVTVSSHGQCLTSSEYADYPLSPKYASSTLLPKLPPVISVRDKQSKQEIFKFQIDDVPDFYYPLELHKCDVYAIRKSNSSSFGLWQYDYHGNGKEILDFSKYSYDFRIDPQERYIALARSYLGKPDYALVIKNLDTMQNAFVLNMSDLVKQYSSSIAGSFGLGSWTSDGNYLDGDIYDGALDTAYYRVEAGTWKTEVFLAPSNLSAGVERAINFNKGYLAYVDIPTFTGVQEVTNQIIQQAIKEGKVKHLLLYDFTTKKTATLATTTPDRRFDMKWLSSTTLQYTLPTGATTTYTIPQ